jgi:hypothetical protein
MARLETVATILCGVNPRQPERQPCHFVQIRNLTNPSESQIAGRRPTAARGVPIQAGDVLLAARGERNAVRLAGQSFYGAYAGLDLFLIRPASAGLDPGYLAAFLSRPSTSALLRKGATGASLPRIPKSAIAELDIPVPELARQRAVAELVRCIDRQIDLMNSLMMATSVLAESSLEHAFERLG